MSTKINIALALCEVSKFDNDLNFEAKFPKFALKFARIFYHSREGGGGVYSEGLRDRNFIRPPPLLYAPHQGWGGCIKLALPGKTS